MVKHDDKYLALGSFCGYDFANLADGALLGEKLYCPCCGSAYDITTGYPEAAPNMRNLSTFPVKINNDDEITITVPEHIPAFSKKRFLKRQQLDPRTFVILGDNETSLAAIDALRSSFTGRIVLIPSKNFGSFENLDIMKR